MEYEQIAHYAFMAFVAIAILAGLAVGFMAYDVRNWHDPAVKDINGYITLLMLILGIIVGLISITAKEVQPFLIAAIALMVTRVGVGTQFDVWNPLTNLHELLYYWATAILNYIVAFVAPAAVIIAIKAVYTMAKEK
jgi:hypothetical protein